MQPLLKAEEVQRFRAEGFVALSQLATPEEVQELQGIFERLFTGKAGFQQGMQFDLAGTDEEVAKLPQILDPARLAPELLTLPLRQRALELARQLIGSEATLWFEHAILKPPYHGAPTPWHQDEAHRNEQGVAYDQISIWIPLREATAENGCMRYIARSHLGPVMPHHSPNDDPRIMALECCGDFAVENALPCPLPPGGAAVHHARTLHSAGPNQSSTPRPAYILVFRGPFRPEPEFQGYPWNLEKRTAAQQRSEAWQNRGGPLGRAGRRASRFAAATLARVRNRARRLLQAKR